MMLGSHPSIRTGGRHCIQHHITDTLMLSSFSSRGALAPQL
ncbi:hypothetical protein FOPG_20225 [Fusarium oxysporum f. sp. conglutinans race 2 54008]|uniref:Uncharacterized protein n=1 Tax=Fusarium oxysporum f. sp. conglutinans race 2 54008 TaxID=1089457 RepID=X0GUH6_FUSOX|nr:hypothetical protein FOPG_20225 [Fusarium oxysporum f. sp. conglutinans race 2 54008]